MKILYLAPQPLYQERGTSIANKLVIEVLSKRGEQVEVVTYHEGEDVTFDNMRIYRIPNLPFVRGVRPGFSIKKLICDAFLFPLAVVRAVRFRPHLVHAVEEAVFMALVLKLFLRIPYVYDMDSSMAQQMVEKYPALRFVAPFLNGMEGLAVRHAKAVVVVCDALGDIARQHAPERIVTLRDVPLLDDNVPQVEEDIRATYGITGPIFMYVGNLEHYQGIDLLLESFVIASAQRPDAGLVIIGGTAEDIAHYTQHSQLLGIGERVHFLGLRPLSHLSAYLAQADILVSPRIKGNNTPMKIYSYLYSGKPCIATDLWTHTQVLNNQVALLATAEPKAFGAAMVRLMNDTDLQHTLGAAGVRLIEEQYDYSIFLDSLNGLMDWLRNETGQPRILRDTHA